MSGPCHASNQSSASVDCGTDKPLGNCLFNALSDQMHGDESKHMEYRAATVQYMVDHPGDFKDFVIVNEGGGHRRNPKRKTHGSLQNRSDMTAPPSEEQVKKAFEQRMKMMAQGGSYGDNLEIVAFGNAYKVDVKVYSEEYKFWYIISAKKSVGEGKYPMLHIVHHVSLH